MKKITFKTMTSGGRRLMMIGVLVLISVLFNVYAVMAQSPTAHSVIYDAGTNTTWTVPHGVVSITVQCWGGGGGGGDNTNIGGACGQGGGGGGYVTATFAVTPGDIFNVWVGPYNVGAHRGFGDASPGNGNYDGAGGTTNNGHSDGDDGGAAYVQNQTTGSEIIAGGGTGGQGGLLTVNYSGFDYVAGAGTGGVYYNTNNGDVSSVSGMMGGNATTTTWGINYWNESVPTNSYGGNGANGGTGGVPGAGGSISSCGTNNGSIGDGPGGGGGGGQIRCGNGGENYGGDGGGGEVVISWVGSPAVWDANTVTTWTIPANVYYVTAQCWGGGGGGGAGGTDYGSGGPVASAGGGGGGGYSESTFAVTPGSQFSVVVGAGGLGGVGATSYISVLAGNSGANGGNSSFGSQVTANGGNGGTGSGETTSFAGVNGFPGSGGAGSYGSIAYGGSGNDGGTSNGGSGGYGGEPGGGAGGAGGAGLLSSFSSGSPDGNYGLIPGGGGGGSGAGAHGEGGNGADGMVVITYCTIIPPVPQYVLDDINYPISNGVICNGTGIFLQLSNSLDYNYWSWSTGSTAQYILVTPSVTTNYTVTITDSYGCTGTAMCTVTVNQLPTPSISGSTIGCSSVSLTATGGTTYLWSGGNSPNSATNTFTSNGTYTVTVTNSNNCSATVSATVTVNPLPTPSIIPNGATTFCSGGSVQLIESVAGVSYNWSNGATTNSINVTSGGSYSITITDNNGCTGVASSSSITVNANPAASTSAGAIACHGGTTSITVSASGGTSPYSGTGVNSVSAGSYSYTVTDANGCHGSTSLSITQPTTLIASSSQGTAIACNGGTTTITVSASGGTTPYSGTGVNTVGAGNYSNIVTDHNGCTASTSQSLSQPTAVTFTTTKTNLSGCSNVKNGSISIMASGGTGTKTYSKNNGATFQGSTLFSNLSVGTYSVKVRDANGCLSASSAIVITQNAGITFTTSIVNATGCTATNGKISVTGSGGSGYFNYSKDSGVTYQSSNIFNSLLNGIYKVRVKDVLNCYSNISNVLVRPVCQSRLEESTGSMKANFNVYPNPAKDKLTVVFSSEKEQSYNLRLIDVTGRIVLNQNHHSVEGDNQYELNLSSISRGLYLVLLQNGDGVMQRKLIVE